MNTYKKIKRKQEKLLKKKQLSCSHETFRDDTIYRKCKECGVYVAFRDPDDVKRRGLIGQAPEYNFDLSENNNNEW